MRKQGLSKSRRMNERQDFVRLFDKPRTFKTKNIQIYYKENDNKSSRLGITIKGKLSSIWRSRLKRVFREWFRLQREEFKINPSDFNIVVHVPRQMNYEFLNVIGEQIKTFRPKT